jgi:ApeA N-terminal domain 1
METQEISERGCFWWAGEPIPDGCFAPECAVPGTLKVEIDGTAVLELDRLLPRSTEPIATILEDSQAEYVIVGALTGKGSYVRLEYARRKSLHFGAGTSMASTHESFVAWNCLVSEMPVAGVGLEPCCTSIRLSLEGFEPWLDLGVALISKTETILTAQLPRQKEHSYVLAEADLTIGVELTASFNYRSSSTTLLQHGVLTYTPHSPMNMDEAKEIACELEDLLILLTNCDRALAWPQVRVQGQDGWNPFYFATLGRSDAQVKAEECWVIFTDVAAHFGKIVEAWRAKREQFGPGFYLYLGTRRGRHLTEEHRFVNLVWGLESLHRRTGQPAGGSKLDVKIQRILDSLPLATAQERKDRAWLEKQLEFAREPNLAARLLDIFSQLPFDLDAKALTAFAKDCASRRNDISHFGGQRKADGYKELLIDLNRLSGALDPLYHACILYEIGTPAEHLRWVFTGGIIGQGIRQALSASHEIRRVLRAAGLELPPGAPKPPPA